MEPFDEKRPTSWPQLFQRTKKAVIAAFGVGVLFYGATPGFCQLRIGASVDESGIQVTYYVKPDGNNNNHGLSSEQAVASLGNAIDKAKSGPLSEGKKTKILVYPGTYLTGNIWQVEWSAMARATVLVIEGTEAGKVILEGMGKEILSVQQKDYLVIRNLTFEKGDANGGLWGGMYHPFAEVREHDWLIDQCVFKDGITTGLTLQGIDNVTVQNCTVSNNGGDGINYIGRYGKFVNVNISGSTRQALGFAGTYCTFDNMTISDNKGPGFRMDHVAEHVTIANSRFERNGKEGAIFETCVGPVLLKNCVSANNKAPGIHLITAHGITIEGCRLFDNVEAQLLINPQDRSAFIEPDGYTAGNLDLRYWMGTKPIKWVKNTKILNSSFCVTQASSAAKLIKRFDQTSYTEYINWFRDELQASGNTYTAPNNTADAFDVSLGYFDRDRTFTDLAGWQAATGEEAGSVVSSACGGNTTFEVTSDKPSVSVAPGASVTTSITVGAFSGFRGDILLSATGLPAGVTASFSPASLSGSGTTTLTLSASSTATAGTATVNVTAQSGSVTGTIAVPITVEAASNPPFSVTLAVPANTVFTAGETIELTPTTSHVDGMVSKVAFYQGSTLLGESTTSPYTFAWTNVPAGSHALTAKAYDNAGKVATSELVNISVQAASSPDFQLSTSASAVSLVAGSSTQVAVTVEAVDGFSAAVDLSVSGLPVGVTAVFSPNSLPSGSSELSLTASSSAAVGSSLLTLTGRSGATTHTVSLSLSVSPVGTPPNQPPTVQLNTPTRDAIVVAGQDLVLRAEASDADGTVSKVAFYQGSTLLGESSTSPYTFTWTNVPAGEYSFVAKATDEKGALTTSAVVTFSVREIENPALVEVSVQPRPWFSPNGDAEGEYWEVEGIEGHPTYQVSIYDRYGQLPYQARPYANNWDGTYQGQPLPAEAYFFAIREVASGKLIKAGSLTLVR